MLAPSFGGRKDEMQALKTVAYAYTAAWLAGGGQILPWVGMLILLAGSLYSIYLLSLTALPVGLALRFPPNAPGRWAFSPRRPKHPMAMAAATP